MRHCIIRSAYVLRQAGLNRSLNLTYVNTLAGNFEIYSLETSQPATLYF